jgi:2-dehydro-3-deoxyphosphogluconate aldolase/(4S)-4-hydroxy-2-oxoglutarate aldolase
MLEKRLMPVVVLKEPGWAEPLAEALLAGGLDVIEVTLRTEAALEGMELIGRKFPGMRVGAGTVLEVEVIPRLRDLGVSFVVSPGLNPRVVDAAREAGMEVYPGVATPTDIEAARALGLEVATLPPAAPLGGGGMLKALIGPYGHTGLRFVPTGGIDAEKARGYATLGEVAAVGGSWFVKAGLMAEGRWDEIERMTREAIELMAAG